MFPILSYDSDLYTPTKGLQSKMDAHWCQVQRSVTNCFQSTSILVLATESCLQPLCVLLKHKRYMATLRLIFSLPGINPASARLSRTFPSLRKARAPDSHRILCTHLNPNLMPLNLNTLLPSLPVRTHLPVDALVHLTLPPLNGLSYAQLINSPLARNLPCLPSEEIMANTSCARKR